MDYRSTYRGFINSYYLSEGLRITFGLCLPPIIGSFLNHESIGLTISIGAICLSIVDSPGPVIHRKNAMLVCNASVFIVSLLTGFASGSAWVMGIVIPLVCFVFSMIGVYGARAASIGLAALFVMVLNMAQRSGNMNNLEYSLLILAGGIWYMVLSLSLYSFRPYRVTRQVLGDLIQSAGDYMLWRAAFYSRKPDYDNIYSNLLDKQVEINEKQNLIRELLYKSRNLVKESTNTGRIILILFIDINDLFERMLSTQVDHHLLHKYFDKSPILDKMRELLLFIAGEINETGLAVKSNKRYLSGPRLEAAMSDFQKEFEEYRDRERTPGNIEGFIILRALFTAMEDFVSRIQTIQQYSSGYNGEDSKKDPRIQNYDQFVTHQDIDAKVFLDNFNWKSNTFRHALRLTIATTAGFIASQFFPLGHGYWILLTIIVIMKPAYSITKKRNWDRLAGTIVGAAIGAGILFLVRDRHVIVGIMIVLMVLAYSFMRTRYLLFVTLMTPYILILLYLLSPLHFQNLVLERLLDTAIGSVIALMANFLLFPDWAYRQYADLLQQVIDSNKGYFHDVTGFLIGKPVPLTQYKLSRKKAYVALANLSDSLNQILAEPKRKQKNVSIYHEVLVLNYLMASHIATLAALSFDKNPLPPDVGYLPVVEAVIDNMDQLIDDLKKGKTSIQQVGGDLVVKNPLEENASSDIPVPINIKDGTTAENIITPMSSNNIPVPIIPIEPVPSLEDKGAAASLAAIEPVLSAAEVKAHEGLSQMNKRVSEMVTHRKKELEQGIQVTNLKTSLSVVKSVNDQFNFIWKISEDLIKSLAAF